MVSLIHQQYAQQATFKEEFGRMVSAVPSAFMQIHRELQSLLTLSSTGDICLLQYVYPSFHVTMRKQVPSANRHKENRLMQAAMCLASIVCGTRMVYVVNRSSWTIVMQQVNTSFLLCAQGTQFKYNLRPHHWVPCGFTSLYNSPFCRLLSRWWSLHQLSDILVGRLYFD